VHWDFIASMRASLMRIFSVQESDLLLQLVDRSAQTLARVAVVGGRTVKVFRRGGSGTFVWVSGEVSTTVSVA
jgi:hypothetical protein